MKSRVIAAVALLFGSLLALAQHGSDFPATRSDGSTLCWASLLNHSETRHYHKDGYPLGKNKELVQITGSSDVLLTAFAWAPDSASKLYGSVHRLPDHIAGVRILYYASKDKKSAMFIGYIIEAPLGTTLATIRYPVPALRYEENDASSWIKWIQKSLASQIPPLLKKP